MISIGLGSLKECTVKIPSDPSYSNSIGLYKYAKHQCRKA